MKSYDGSDLCFVTILGSIVGAVIMGIVWILMSPLSCSPKDESITTKSSTMFIPSAVTYNKMLCTYENSYTAYHAVTVGYRCLDGGLLIKNFTLGN